MRLTAQDLREMNILKYYRLTRKWVCKTYGLKDADLELLIYLDCKKRFTRKDFMDGVYTYSWDKQRWDRLRQGGYASLVFDAVNSVWPIDNLESIQIKRHLTCHTIASD